METSQSGHGEGLGADAPAEPGADSGNPPATLKPLLNSPLNPLLFLHAPHAVKESDRARPDAAELEEPELPRANMKCLSPYCEFRVHTDEEMGSYCCIACFSTMGCEHGFRCERAPVIPRDPSGAEEAEGQHLAKSNGVSQEAGGTDGDARKPTTEDKGAPKEEVKVEMSKEEKEARKVMEEAKMLAKKIQVAAGALLKEASTKEEASSAADDDFLRTLEAGGAGNVPGRDGSHGASGEGAEGAQREGAATNGEVEAAKDDAHREKKKELLAKTLNDTASVILNDKLMDESKQLAKKLQDAAFALLKEGYPKAGQEGSSSKKKTEVKEVKHADSEVQEEKPKTLADWRNEVEKKSKGGDKEALAKVWQDAATAFLEGNEAEEARELARKAEAYFRKVNSRWRLGVALDTCAMTYLKPLEACSPAALQEAKPQEECKEALAAASEAVALLRKIGHPKEQASLASARSTLAKLRGLTGAEELQKAGDAPALEDAKPKEDQPAKKSTAEAWRRAVADQRRLYRQAPKGRGNPEGLATTLKKAAEELLKDGLVEEARQSAEEAATLFRKINAVKRLGSTLYVLAKAHLELLGAQGGAGADPEAELLGRQHRLRAMTAASESVSLLSKHKASDWKTALEAARCTLLRVRALELPDTSGQGTVKGIFQSLTSKLNVFGGSSALKPTFGYAAGLEKPTPFARFDIRDDVCLRAGGFTHNQVVQDPDGDKYVVVGVRPSDEDAKLHQLWFQPKGLTWPASCCFTGLTVSALRALLSEAGTEVLPEVEAEALDAEADSDGELVTLCHECLLPLGVTRYCNHDGEGYLHGECMARMLLDGAREADSMRERDAARRKVKDRLEYSIGWKPDHMIPCNAGFLKKGGLQRPPGSKPESMYCLVLEGKDPPKLKLVQTSDPEAFINLQYLVLALQVRIKAGMAPYFSLDTPHADKAWQCKTFGPTWMKGTSVGEVLFQADYHLKELSMGDSSWKQPVIGMKNCWDFPWKEESWRGREWFVVKNAQVFLSDNNVLIPHVVMGVEARQQDPNEKNELVDAPVTSAGHPLVKFAEMFTHNFALIAERKSVIYQLREVSKAAIVAKFLVDNKVSLDDFWLTTQEEAKITKIDLPFNKKERHFYEILVCDGAIHEQHGGVLSSMVGLYGGVDLNIDAFDLTMPVRVSKTIETPNYSAIYADPGHMGTPSDLEKLSQRELRRLVQESGGQPPRGPTEKADLIELLLSLRPQDPEEAPGAAAKPDEDDALKYESALVEDLRKLSLPDETVHAIIDANRARAAGTSQTDEALFAKAAPETRKFWSDVNSDAENASLFRAVYNSPLSDRKQERSVFVPPISKDSYIQSLRDLVDEERQVQARRRSHFLSEDFIPGAPGELFPSAWRSTFTMHFGRGTSVTAGGAAAQVRQLVRSDADGRHLLQLVKPIFDRSTEDGTRFRIYRHGSLEVRTVEEEPEEECAREEAVGAVYELRPLPPPSERHPIVKVTEFVRSAETDARAAPPEGGAAGAREGKGADAAAGAGGASWRFFVVYETDLGDVIMAEKLPTGEVTAAENPVDIEERYAHSRVLRVADCSRTGATVGDVRRQLHEDAARSFPSARRYAQEAFDRAGGTLISKPGMSQVLRPTEVLRRPGYQY